jgi:hypothetical protein
MSVQKKTGTHGGTRPGAGRKATDVSTRYREAQALKEEGLARLRQMEADERAGKLIPADDVAQTVSTAFARIAQTVWGLPDLLERKAGLSPAQAETAQRAIHDVMDVLADDLSKLGTDTAA